MQEQKEKQEKREEKKHRIKRLTTRLFVASRNEKTTVSLGFLKIRKRKSRKTLVMAAARYN